VRDSVPAVRRDSVQASAAPGSGRWSIILPGITFAPETRWAAAIGGFKVTKSAPSPGQRPNTYAVRGLYSQRHQVQASFSLDRWSTDNAGRIEFDAAFSRFPNSFYGVRAALADSAEQYTPRTASLVGSYVHRARPGLYLGGRVALEDAALTAIADGGTLATLLTTPAFAGGERWRTASATLIASWDTRDVFFFPTRGSAVWLNIGRALGVPGATHQFTRISLDARRYQPLGRGLVLAVQGFGVFTEGRVPVDNLPALGGASLLRGYFAGRFRDRTALATQVELRTPTWRRLGAVAFAGAGAVGPTPNALSRDDMRSAWGVGVRFALNGDRLNLRIDRGFGTGSRGIYITAGEAF
jgi:outer membrane protein assembly factor BamA